MTDPPVSLAAKAEQHKLAEAARRKERRADLKIALAARKLTTACHEAAHALAAIEVGIGFRAVHLGKRGIITLSDGSIHEADGTMEFLEPMTSALVAAHPHDYLFVFLAGPAATAKALGYTWHDMRICYEEAGDMEHASNAAYCLQPAMEDIEGESGEAWLTRLNQLWEVVEITQKDFHAKSSRWVEEHWDMITRIGEALLQAGP